MGQASASIAFHANAASLSGEGLESVVSGPIDIITPDEFWALLAMDLRNAARCQAEVKRQTLESGKESEEGLVVLHSDRIYEWFLFRSPDEAECYCYGADVTLSRPESRGTLRVHRGPFRIEFWSVVYGQRAASDELRGAMTKLLRTMRSKAECAVDIDSPGGGGLKCVLSEPILDLSPEVFWKRTKELLQTRAVKALPDGGLVQEAAAEWASADSRAAYTKHLLNDAAKELVSYAYRDAGLSDASLEAVQRVKVHSWPFRLEMWMASADRRRAGEAEKEELLMFLASVLEQAKLLATCPHAMADEAELSSLFNEVSAFRQEMSSALEVLHEGAEALQAW